MADIVNSYKAPYSYFCLFVEKLLNSSRKPIHATNGNTSPLKNYTVYISNNLISIYLFINKLIFAGYI